LSREENKGCWTASGKGKQTPMRNLPEARVARLAECHKKQKANYNQHTNLWNSETKSTIYLRFLKNVMFSGLQTKVKQSCTRQVTDSINSQNAL
jgi:hypothetical protein